MSLNDRNLLLARAVVAGPERASRLVSALGNTQALAAEDLEFFRAISKAKDLPEQRAEAERWVQSRLEHDQAVGEAYGRYRAALVNLETERRSAGDGS